MLIKVFSMMSKIHKIYGVPNDSCIIIGKIYIFDNEKIEESE